MKPSTLTGILAGAAVVTAGLAIASFRILEGDILFAEVLAVQPVVESVRKAREECPEELTARESAASNSREATAALRIAAARTGSGAKTGSGPATNPNCRTVYDSILETVGYDVVYRLGDRQGTVRMDHDPGERIPVKDGELVLEANPG